jgi:hypothetical protein
MRTHLGKHGYAWASRLFGGFLAGALVLVTAAPAHALTAPVLSVGTVTQTSVQLNWTDAGNEQEYRVYKDNVIYVTLPANTLTYTVPNLTPNTTYSFYVHAKKGGQILSSLTVQATTLPTSGGCVGVNVPLTADLRTTFNTYGPGTTYCLAAGTYTVPDTADYAELRMDEGDVVWGAGKASTFIQTTNAAVNIVSGTAGSPYAYTFRDLTIGYSGQKVDPGCGACGRGFSSGRITLTNVRCHDLGTLCVNFPVLGLNADNVECDGNGWIFRLSSENSCFKVGGNNGGPVTVSITNSNIHDNPGMGLWFAYCGQSGLGCTVLIENTQIVHNGACGVDWEVSGNFAGTNTLTVRNNTIQNNGWNPSPYAVGCAGVALVDSSNADIGGGNIFGGNLYVDSASTSVCCTAASASEGTRDPAPMFNDTVHDNTLNGEILRNCAPAIPGVTCTNNT